MFLEGTITVLTQRPVLRAVLDLSLPSRAGNDCLPHLPEERLGMVPGIDDAMRLSDQFCLAVAADFDELFVGIGDPAAHVRGADDRQGFECLGKRMLAVIA